MNRLDKFFIFLFVLLSGFIASLVIIFDLSFHKGGLSFSYQDITRGTLDYRKEGVELVLEEPIFRVNLLKKNETDPLLIVDWLKAISPHVSCRIEQGMIDIGSLMIPFDLSFDRSAYITFDSPLGIKGGIDLKEATYKMMFDHLYFPALIRGFEDYLAPLPFWWVKEGYIQGEIEGPLKRIKEFKADLLLQNLIAGNKEEGSELLVEEVHYKSESGYSIQGFEFRIKELDKGIDFGVESICGHVLLLPTGGIEFNLEGILCQGDETFPLLLKGKNGQTGTSHLDIDAKLSLENGLGLLSYLRLSIAEVGSHEYLVQGKLENIAHDELLALHQIFRRHLPPLDQVAISDACLAMEINGRWKNGRLETVEIDHLQGDFCLSLYQEPPLPMRLEGKVIDGKIFEGKIIDKISQGELQFYYAEDCKIAKGKSLSSSLINSLTKLQRDGFEFVGEVDLDMKLEGKKIDFTIESTSLQYATKDLHFHLSLLPLVGHLTYDLALDELQGHLFVQEGAIQFNEQALEISKISTDIYLNNRHLFFESTTAKIDNIDLKGSLSLQEYATGGSQLQIILDEAKGDVSSLFSFLRRFHLVPIPPIEIQGVFSLGNKKAFFEKDLTGTFPLIYEVELELSGGSIHFNQQQIRSLYAYVGLSSLRDSIDFNVKIEHDAYEWGRLQGSIERGLLQIDQQNSHLFQNPFKEVELGVLEGGLGFVLGKEEFSMIDRILDFSLRDWFEELNCYIGFRDGGERIALNLKSKEGEITFTKEASLLALSKGVFSFNRHEVEWEPVSYDLITEEFSAPHISWTGKMSEGKLSIINDCLEIVHLKVDGKTIKTLQPFSLKLKDQLLVVDGGAIEIDRGTEILLSEVYISLQDFTILVDSARFSIKELAPLWGSPPLTSPIEGRLKGTLSQNGFIGSVQLTPRVLSLFGEKIQIEKVDITIDEGNYFMSLFSSWQNEHFRLKVVAKEADYMKIHIQCEGFKGAAEADLTYDPSFGFMIHKTKGSIPGLEWHFVPEYRLRDEEMIFLQGFSRLHLEELSPLLVAKFLSSLEAIGLKKELELIGRVTIPRVDPTKTEFRGEINSRQFRLMGLQLRTLQGFLALNKERIILEDLTLFDQAFTLELHRASLAFLTNAIQVEELNLYNLRPSQLRIVNSQSIIAKKARGRRASPFVIPELSLSNLKGSLDHTEQIVGQGHFSFTNIEKKEANILDIPIELIARLGLDMNLLEPVTGEVTFEIGNQRIEFLKLKNAYSEGKRSRFLFHPTNPSYIDFDGNVHVRIRMKQAVLLKLTQLFTLSIDGPISDLSFKLK